MPGLTSPSVKQVPSDTVWQAGAAVAASWGLAQAETFEIGKEIQKARAFFRSTPEKELVQLYLSPTLTERCGVKSGYVRLTCSLTPLAPPYPPQLIVGYRKTHRY